MLCARSLARSLPRRNRDWAPYAAGYQKTSTGSTTFSKGMWKSVYLAAVPTGGAAITHVVPLTYYNGAYPSLPLTDATHAGFTLKVRAHMWAPATVTGSVVVAGSWGGNSNPTPVSLPAGESNATISLVAGPGSVKLWWPNGLPGLLQNLYSVSATFTSAAPAAPPAAAQRSLGFRVFTLVTGNDTDPSTLAGKDGSGFFTMRFKVNGANLWSRGGEPSERARKRASERAGGRSRGNGARARARAHSQPLRNPTPVPGHSRTLAAPQI